MGKIEGAGMSKISLKLPLMSLTCLQEIRNITWIAECIAQNQKERIGNYISVF